jgi:hypothetical protein
MQGLNDSSVEMLASSRLGLGRSEMGRLVGIGRLVGVRGGFLLGNASI